jgi:hypothetical protein
MAKSIIQEIKERHAHEDASAPVIVDRGAKYAKTYGKSRRYHQQRLAHFHITARGEIYDEMQPAQIEPKQARFANDEVLRVLHSIDAEINALMLRKQNVMSQYFAYCEPITVEDVREYQRTESN